MNAEPIAKNTIISKSFCAVRAGLPASGLSILRGMVTGLLLAASLLLASPANADVAARISGIVQDSSGALLPGAQILAINEQTGIQTTVTADGKGFYSLPELPIGSYRVRVSKEGFKTYEQSGLLLRVNDSVRVDVTLTVGNVAQQVEVAAEGVRVETTSTQLGEVINEQKIEAMPLNGRSYTDLLALQAGVVPQTSGLSGGMGGEFTSTGFGIQPVSGELNSGNLSVNGMREAANGFLLNGAPVQETAFSGTSAIPNLDSIEEFRILTNNVDPEYGNYAGGQVNVITKSGTNSWHGSAFEFARNTAFDATPYSFSQPLLTNPIFRQHQFGGTAGGPIKHDKIFFFADYQGTRLKLGANSNSTVVPSVAERTGDFSALAANEGFATCVMSGMQQVCTPNTVISATPAVAGDWASVLTSELNYSVTAGEPYYFTANDINPNTNTKYGVNCTSSSQCVFPNAQVPTLTAPSKNLLPYIPQPNAVNSSGQPVYSSAKIPTVLQDDKGSGRIDANTALGLLSGYYFYDGNTLFNPNPVEPGFGNGSSGRDQVIDFGDTKTLSSRSVNEARISYTRLYEVVNQPFGGIGSGLLSQLGFTNIVPSVPQFAGVPQIGFNNFNIGSGSSPLPIIENTYSALDNFSKVVGTHTLKFGGLVRFIQMTEKNLGSNGQFSFNGTETGIDFADFLIGAPNHYQQGQGFPSAGRTHYLGFYGQDSWRARPDLTVNYGLRYDISRPWSELRNEIQTIIPGENSVVFPGSPTGWVFPGDPHVPNTLAPTRFDNIAPRLGIAYSPSQHTALDKLTGGPGNFSIRAAWGKFYTSFEGATNFNEIGDAPFGGFYGSSSAPQFANPYITRSNGAVNPQPFPIAPPPYNISAQHPDTSIDWANFVSIGSSPAFYYKNATPYAEQYDLAIDRQLPENMLLTIAYVGSQGHHLLSAIESNPGDPALCLQLAAYGCNYKNGIDGVYVTPAQTYYGTRPTLMGQTNGTPNFTSDAWFKTIGNSSYNSLQVTVRRSKGRLDFLAAYTYSKSMDNASGYGEGINPIDPNRKALSAFNSTNNFVVSDSYRLPIDARVRNRFTSGWTISSTTHFATGLPVTLIENDDRSLLGTAGGGPIQLPIDTPDYTPGPLNFSNPRTNPIYFNTSLFSLEPVGQLGDASRRFFHGPGINNWDIAFAKDTKITEKTNLEFRADFFNAFNHAQFGEPDGNINDKQTFGEISSASLGRIIQFAAKVQF